MKGKKASGNDGSSVIVQPTTVSDDSKSPSGPDSLSGPLLCSHCKERPVHPGRKLCLRCYVKNWRLQQRAKRTRIRDTLLQEQDSKCAICGKDLSLAADNEYHLDHDHKTGRYRGVLCAGHNTGLGLFKDSPELLRAAADYIERASLFVKEQEEEAARMQREDIAASFWCSTWIDDHEGACPERATQCVWKKLEDGSLDFKYVCDKHAETARQQGYR